MTSLRPGQGVGLALLLLLCFSVLDSAKGLTCYSCATQGNLDPRCEKNPASVPGLPVVTCPLKYCTTRRQEFADPQGVLSSFFRGCEERPLFTNQVVASGNLVTYYRACQTDLCNAGDGTETTDSGGGGGGWLDGGQWGGGDGGLLLTPGVGAAPTASVANLLLVLGAAGAAAVLAARRGGG